METAQSTEPTRYQKRRALRRPNGFDLAILNLVIADLSKGGVWGPALGHHQIAVLDNECRRPELMGQKYLKRLLRYLQELEKDTEVNAQKIITVNHIGRECRPEIRQALGIPW